MSDLLDRVRKLLALAGSPNVHEATAAAAKAQALIDAHRLQALLDAEDAAAQVEVVERVLERARRLRRWKSVLAAGLAEVNGCLAYTREDGKHVEVVVVGPASELDTLQALYDGLVPRLQWLSADHGGKQDKRWHDDFRVGAAATLVERLAAASKQDRASVDATALAVVEPALQVRRDAVQDYAERELHLKRGRGIRVDLDAYEGGLAAGEEVDL